MNRVALVVLALSGVSAGALGADTLVRRRVLLDSLQDPMVMLAVAAAGLALTAVVVWSTRRPAPARAPLSEGGEFIRRRVQMLAADGATPERIARDTGLSRDLVVMALRAAGDARPTQAAGSAQRRVGRRAGSAAPRTA
jgi:hypothetical protein